MSLSPIDKLNVLYYGEMELSAAEKKLRIVMAGALQGIVKKHYDTVQAVLKKSSDDRRSLLLAAAVASLRKAYLGFFDKFYEQYVSSIFRGGQPYYGVDGWRTQHALDFAVWLIKTARGEPNIAFAQSHSLTVTRTEVNAVGNLAALDAAYRSGMRFKEWATFGDGKVRPSHKAVNGTRIPIDEAFTVGGSKLMFPGDTSLGAGAEEISNCRCTLKFFLTNSDRRGIMVTRSGSVSENKRTGGGGKQLTNNESGSVIKLRVNMFDKSDPLYLDAFGIEEDDEFEDICLHGCPDSVQRMVNGKPVNMNADEFAAFLKENTSYRGGNIRLASCSTGKGENSFAQKLSKILGVTVKAPDDDVYYAPDEGTLFVGSPYANTGRWRVFRNGDEVL